ncbi:MAG: hypothetical protein HFI33_11975 [Lachnospiraceae bacterium]|nr:hypothetical protein [Lachnospiraceae bacterium]
MRCFKCGKNFDYEKYYGICPKCGCYNKRETQEEQHQDLHDRYDSGYTHRQETSGYGMGNGTQGYGPGGGYGMGNGYSQPVVKITEVRSWRNQKGGTAFLVISILIFVAAIVGGTLFGVSYGERQEKRVKEELLSYVPPVWEHELGACFTFQDVELTVEEVTLLGTEEELGLPVGMKMVAVRLSGSGDGTWNYQNRLPELYIRTPEAACYMQISSYEYEIYGSVFGMEALDTYALCEDGEADGWVAFLLDEEEQTFTLYLEEREGEYLQKIEKLHAIALEISEGDRR